MIFFWLRVGLASSASVWTGEIWRLFLGLLLNDLFGLLPSLPFLSLSLSPVRPSVRSVGHKTPPESHVPPTGSRHERIPTVLTS